MNVLKHAYGRNKADAEKAVVNIGYCGVIVGDELGDKVDMPSGPRPYGTDLTIASPESIRRALTAANGAIDVRVHGGGIDASTTNGPINSYLAELTPTEAVALGTTTGDVALLLTADVSTTIDATDSNATIGIFDFSAVVYEVQQEHHVRARIGSGASSVTITTSNASITVRARS